MLVILVIEPKIFVEGVSGQAIVDSLLDCEDDAYRRWWPGTHLAFHPLRRGARSADGRSSRGS